MDKKRMEYIKNLETLDFQIENQDNSSIYLVDKLEEYIKQDDVSPYIIIALDKAKLFDADAVYFRFFDDNRPPLAQIYLYDNIQKQKNSEYYAEKHREIWSSCEVAVFFVIDKTTIRIYDSRKPVETNNDGSISSKTIDCIDFLSDVNNAINKYRAQNFNNGSFWENQLSGNNFLDSKIASERLINGLRIVRNELRKSKLSYALIDKLLIICILIKYLEETGIDKNGENYACAFFKKATGYEKLESIIFNNKLHCLLTELTKHFNGGIFHIDDNFKEELQKSDISILSHFFEAGYKNNLFGWKEYSFEHIPIELISNFYEEFIPKIGTNNKKDTGAVYTPSFVVNLLIDENLPLNNLDENIKLMDPACGSGIFLVAAYKRLVQRWRIKNIAQNKLADTNPKILKGILSKNIFGVDVNPNSINLSMFSLQLALCSMLTPKQIWTELQFIDLKADGNLVQKDFFEYLIQDNTRYDYDLVIGNPPFNKRKLNEKTYEYYIELLNDKFPIKFKNPKKEFALLFLEKAMHLLEEKKGKLCLILPSGSLLYTDNSLFFRKNLFSTYNIKQIIDFTFLRRVLFEATVASLAIFVDCNQPTEFPILHITAKRTKQSKERFYFEFDHYDFYQVPKNLAVDKLNVWKCNLLGGFRVCDIIDNFNKIEPNFKTWCASNEITISGTVFEDDLFDGVEKKIVKELLLFEKEIFTPKNRLDCWGIKKNITKGMFPTEISAKDFKKRTFDGIEFKGTPEKIQSLKNYFNEYSDLIAFYITAISGRQGIRSPYVFELVDLKETPYFPNRDNISESDKIIIDDVIKYTLEEFGQGEKSPINTEIASKENLIDFAHIYSENLNRYYSSDGKQYKLINLMQGDAYFVCELKYTDEKVSKISFEKREDSLVDLLTEWNPSESAKIHKIIRYYDNENNIIRIIKPKQLRFWLKSKALRDADETFDDILTH
ncbi:MAG: SAM-dependent methyltransferase [Bacteroidales bacterium]|jgi:type I restriction-modification system DNA methylase subunit|nr:SAM-dependent methyltransferase [Bacteroidales bacterium]